MARWWRRRPRRPEFVASGPSLAERLKRVLAGPGRRSPLARAGAALWLLATSPVRWAGERARTTGRATASALGSLFRRGGRRKPAHLLYGLPAVLGLLAAAGLAVAARHQAPKLALQYRADAWGALQAGRNDDARLYFERVIRLDGGTPEAYFGYARALERGGDAGLARGALARAADAGHADACVRLAELELADAARPGHDRLRAAMPLLLKAERTAPDRPAVLAPLANVLLASGQPEEAAARLERASRIDPALLHPYARVCASLGRPEVARAALERSVGHFEARVTSDPQDPAVRIKLAESLASLGRLDEALATLRNGHQLDPKGPCGPVAAKLLTAVYDGLANRTPRDYAAMLRLLKDALAYDPRSTDAATRLANFGEPARDGAEPPAAVSSEVDAVLTELLASGVSPAATHMALGLRATRGGRNDDAVWHFEQAYRQDPSLAGVANNLAWTLAHGDDPQLARALKVIEPVVANWPDVVAYHDTHGEILLRLGRWEEAVTAFERALPGMRETPRIHESLASAYRNLGRREMVELHERQAKRLRDAASRDADVAG